jgi:hypothetical protein
MEKIYTIFLIGLLFVSSFVTACSSVSNVMDEYDMVIICPEGFSTIVQKLIDHKNNYDIKTFSKNTNEIYDKYYGRDNAEKIKYFIKDAIEIYGVRHVLLFGGKKGQTMEWHIPVRYVNLNDDIGSYSTFISDLYYADVYKDGNEFEDWDDNGNNIFAEWNKDHLDLQPDICIGRLPCRNKFEAAIVVNKIITYENNAYNQPWFNTMVAVGGDTFSNSPGYEGEATCEMAISYTKDFDVIRLYTSNGNLKTSNDLINALNQGCGFLLTRGRGGQDRIRMVKTDGSELLAIQNKDIFELKNKDKYPICVLGECIHAKIDVSIFNLLKYIKREPDVFLKDCIFECISWRLINKINGGAIAVLSNTNICFGVMGDSNDNGILDDAEKYGGLLAVEVFRIYGEEGINTLGEIHFRTVYDYVSNFQCSKDKIHCKSVQEWILLGDPSLKIGGYE